MGGAADTHHGTAIAMGDSAALITGQSGAGKSDLALRCLATAPSPLIPLPVHLVADDRVLISAVDGRLRAEAPESIAGKLEVRGMGIVEVPFLRSADIVLIVELMPSGAVQRLPDPPLRREVMGHSLPLLQLCPFEASAPLKLLLALTRLAQMSAKPLET